MLDRTPATEPQATTPAGSERALDEVLAESFPASDPPSWTPGIVRPEPITLPEPRRDRQRTSQQGFVSLGGATSLAVLAPLFILVIALPAVVVVRGILEVIGWLFGVDLLTRR